jgi:hypothetical protein
MDVRPDERSSGQIVVDDAARKTACITPGSPWVIGFIESCNARLSDERLDGEFFSSLAEARIVIES